MCSRWRSDAASWHGVGRGTRVGLLMNRADWLTDGIRRVALRRRAGAAQHARAPARTCLLRSADVSLLVSVRSTTAVDYAAMLGDPPGIGTARVPAFHAQLPALRQIVWADGSGDGGARWWHRAMRSATWPGL